MFASTSFSNSRQNGYERHFGKMQYEQRMRDSQFAKQTMQYEECTQQIFEVQTWVKEQERQTAEYENV